MNRLLLPWCLTLAAGMSSCGLLDNSKQMEEFQKQPGLNPGSIPADLRADPAGPAGTPVTPGGNLAGSFKLVPEEEIEYTNPDDPNGQIPDFARNASAKTSKFWEDSEPVARKRSSREGKALLMVFTTTDMKNPGGALGQVLSDELFSSEPFGTFATDRLIRLKVDGNVGVKDPKLSLDASEARRIDIRNQVAGLRKRYKIMGYPSMVMLSPSGEVVGRWTGYKRGDAQFVLGQMKHAESVSARGYAAWRGSLEKKGYRDWQDRQERKVFARLESYSGGELILIEPDGTRCRTHEAKLSDADRAWIAEQKKIRNIP